MENLYVLVHFLSVVALVLITGMKPDRTLISWFELNRRSKRGDKASKLILDREEKLHDVLSLQRVVAALLLVLISLIGVSAYGWGWGLIISLFLALEAGALSRLKPFQVVSRFIYIRIEPKLLRSVDKFSLFYRLIRNVYPLAQENSINSKEELIHLVEESGDVLKDEERTLIQNGLTFDEKLVNEVMIPKSVVDTVKKSEILGPIVLDDLHKTGHSRFPVINRDIDHVVGVLHVQDMMILSGDSKSPTVERVMEKKVYYIDQNKTLGYALAGFIKTKHHLFIVVNKFRETVGIISIEDVIEALIGRKIVDEFDNYDDLRAVASKNMQANNKPKSREDI